MFIKKYEYVNLNVTFGGEPLLNYFDTIFMPALHENYLTEGNDKRFKYNFQELKVEQLENGDYILHGLIVKDAELEIKSTFNGKDKSKIKKLTKSTNRLHTQCLYYF